jgi:hypothetical protein
LRVASSDYSGTPLERKLGVAPGKRVVLVGAPQGFTLEGVEARRRLAAETDLIVCF